MPVKILIFCLMINIALTGHCKDPFELPQQSSDWILYIRYANATQVATQISNKNNKFLSPLGHVVADKRTNSIWIEDDREHLLKIKRYISAIDTPIQQILIKAKIIMMDQHSMQEIGSYFSSTSVGDDKEKTITLPLLNISKQNLLNLKLIALEQQGHVHIVAMPELITNNRQTAEIESGEELPYQEKSGEGNTSIAFKKAVLQLKVTPTLLPHRKILLNLLISQNKPSSLLVQGIPSITTQQLKTTVVINDKQTLILGGISQQMTNIANSGVPFLNKIPLLGRLFTDEQRNDSRKRLMIFITPETQ